VNIPPVCGVLSAHTTPAYFVAVRLAQAEALVVAQQAEIAALRALLDEMAQELEIIYGLQDQGAAALLAEAVA